MRFIQIFQQISKIGVEEDGFRFDPKTVKANAPKKTPTSAGPPCVFDIELKVCREEYRPRAPELLAATKNLCENGLRRETEGPCHHYRNSTPFWIGFWR